MEQRCLRGEEMQGCTFLNLLKGRKGDGRSTVRQFSYFMGPWQCTVKKSLTVLQIRAPTSQGAVMGWLVFLALSFALWWFKRSLESLLRRDAGQLRVTLASASTLSGSVVRTLRGGEGLSNMLCLVASSLRHLCSLCSIVCGSSLQRGHRGSAEGSRRLA